MPPFSPSDFNRLAQRAGKDINAPVGESGQTLLHVSAQQGDVAAIARLLKLGADLNQRDVNGQTPLYAAVAAQDAAVVRLLLENGARFNDEDGSRTSPLQWAIEKKATVAFVEQLRSLGARLDATGSDGRTLLHAAAAGNNTDVLSWLLKNNAVIDAADTAGKAPLHAAVERGAHDTMRLLLENGADPLLRTSDIKTPLYLAAEKGDATAADILLERSAVQQTLNDYRSFAMGFTPLMAAVANGHVALAEKLLDVGAYINDKDLKNRHSLFIAAETGTPEMMKMLIRRGADVAKAPLHSDNSQPMVHRIGGVNYREKLLLLIEAGADINATDNFGGTALSYGVDSYDAARVQVLLALGANPDQANKAGRRPIDRALELSVYYEEAFKIVTALLAAGASPNLAPDERVYAAPLHTAARSGSVKAVKLLLDYGAVADVPERYQGATPWLLAAGAPSFEICEMLRERGADMTVKDKTGRGILHYAARSDELRLIEAALKNPVLKAQIDAVDTTGSTPLHDAIKAYRTNSARVLLAAGADPLVCDTAGLTALHHLVRYVNEPLITAMTDVLAKKGASWNVPSLIEKQTPLHIAARDGMASLDYLLKVDNIDMTVRDNRGFTPLMAAAAAEKSWSVRALAEAMKKKKISLDAARDNTGLAALHHAAFSQYGAVASMTTLLDFGADINLRTDLGDTSLHIAVSRGRTDIVNMLVQRGADVTIANKAGATALDLARATNKQDIIALLQDALKERQKKLAQQQMPPSRFSNRPRPPAP